jgi:uncharacterized protein
MSIAMEQNKRRGKKGTLKSAIFSARKKPARRAVRRYVLASVVLLIVLAVAVLVLIRVLQRGNGGVASAPPPPLIGSPLTPDETRARIAALNGEITGALSDIGLTPDSATELTETGENRPDIEYIQIREHYAVGPELRPERVRQYLKDYVEGFRGVLSEETTETADGGFEMTVFAYGLPVRSLSFSTKKGLPPPPPPTAKLPKVAIIIDDMGADRAALADLLSLKYPVTIAVMPFLEYSTETAETAHKKGREVILHLPMEPIDYPQYNPGAGALYTFMTAEEFRAALAKDLGAVPHISGVNNHMGSLLTQDREKMEIVLSAIRERGLFFVDSRTTPKTVGYDVAIKLGVSALERNVFLDNEANVESVKKQIDELIKKAKADGKALGIGHPRPGTIKALKEMEKRLTGSEVQVVPASGLLK